MINFRNDYASVGHIDVVNALLNNVNNQYAGYGLDECSESAKKLIQTLIKDKNADVHFLPGGTVTNKIMIAHALKPYEAVIACDSGHINVHETGAIEATGHKILTIESYRGKLIPNYVIGVYNAHTDEHMVKPKMLYISNTTEYGTVYTLSELKELSRLAKKLDMYLFMDGARLGAALTSDKCDYEMKDIAKYVDAFYIGGTKNGAPLGEALVIINDKLKENFRYNVKRNGGMLAKGFVPGICFEELFKNNLFFDIAKKQNKLAKMLSDGLNELKVPMLLECESNQVFPIFKKGIADKLSKFIEFNVWEERKDSTVVRFVTNFMHSEEDVKEALSIIEKYAK